MLRESSVHLLHNCKLNASTVDHRRLVHPLVQNFAQESDPPNKVRLVHASLCTGM